MIKSYKNSESKANMRQRARLIFFYIPYVFITAMPIFISFHQSDGIDFDRGPDNFKAYLFSIPLSFLSVIFLILPAARSVRSTLWFFLLLLCIMFCVFFEVPLSPVVSLFIFLIFFYSNLHFIRPLELGRLNFLLFTFIFLMYTTQAIILFSDIILGLEYTTFLFEGIKIYNYEQYFAICLAISFSCLVLLCYKNRLIIFVAYFFALIGALHSESSTGAAILSIILLLRFAGIAHWRRRYLQVLFLILAIGPVLGPFIVYNFYNLGMLTRDDLNGRVSIWSEYLSSVSILNALPRSIISNEVFSTSPHNMFLYAVETFGLPISVILYFSIIRIFYRLVPLLVGVFFIIIIGIGGSVLELITHPYFALQLAFATAVFSRIQLSQRKVL